MRSYMKIKNRNVKYLKLFIVFICLFFHGCYKMNIQDIELIENFVNDFYQNRMEFTVEEFPELFYRNKVGFMFSNHDEHKGFYSDSAEELSDYLVNSISLTGHILDKEKIEISYHKSIYDVTENNLYFASYRIKYLEAENVETFLLKIENELVKIYRYTIEVQ